MSKVSFSREPAAWIGATSSLLLVAADFGFHLSDTTTGHILTAVPLLVALFIRQTVTPNGSVPAVVTTTVQPMPALQVTDVVGFFLDAVKSNEQDIAAAQARLDTIRAAAASVASTDTVPPTPS